MYTFVRKASHTRAIALQRNEARVCARMLERPQLPQHSVRSYAVRAWSLSVWCILVMLPPHATVTMSLCCAGVNGVTERTYFHGGHRRTDHILKNKIYTTSTKHSHTSMYGLVPWVGGWWWGMG